MPHLYSIYTPYSLSIHYLVFKFIYIFLLKLPACLTWMLEEVPWLIKKKHLFWVLSTLQIIVKTSIIASRPIFKPLNGFWFLVEWSKSALISLKTQSGPCTIWPCFCNSPHSSRTGHFKDLLYEPYFLIPQGLCACCLEFCTLLPLLSPNQPLICTHFF